MTPKLQNFKLKKTEEEDSTVSAMELLLCLSIGILSAYVTTVSSQSFGNQPSSLCGNWDCKCAMNQDMDCCCIFEKYQRYEEYLMNLMSDSYYQVEQLSQVPNLIQASYQVAFSVTLNKSKCYGPFTVSAPVAYNNVLLNRGNGYRPSLGVFTAPTAGVYSISYTVFSNDNTTPSSNARIYHSVSLMKNGDDILTVWKDNRKDLEDSGTHGIILVLEKGDQIYLHLLAGRYLCNDLFKSNTFSGYLLYPL
ncbi:cerebellin-4-like [Protopterus annectens]|uniref:cerebellin-4-like n=1 Tax=Protopterus annectens TaxID=7888 RepID=UPI001CF953D5|nr:cerebellin-4-like [Protopterus annectens]